MLVLLFCIVCRFVVVSSTVGVGVDEDIPTPKPPAAKEKPDDIRIGPITRARAKLLEQ